MKLKTLTPRVALLKSTLAAPLEHQRRNSTRAGYGYRWQQYRARWLREHPLCGDRANGPSAEHSVCAREGRVSAATDVDHIQRINGPDDPLFWDERNHQSMCHKCHSLKTAEEDRIIRSGGGQ